MKLVFVDRSDTAFTPDTPYLEPLGGTQSAVAYLSAALAARGHEITLVSRQHQPGLHRGVTCIRRRDASVALLNGADAVVAVTSPNGAAMINGGVTTPLILWQHKTADASGVAPLADPAERAAWRGVVYVSETQRQDFLGRFGLDGAVLRNALSPSSLALPPRETTFIDEGRGPRLIYASAPGRQLDLLLTLFPTIRAAFPDATLRIFSDSGLYQEGGEADAYKVYYDLARALPGVEYVGTVGQAELAAAMRDTDVFAYPTAFVETACIVLMEAAAAGCLLITTNTGALKETAAGYGVCLDLPDQRAQYCALFAAAVIDQLGNASADPAAFRTARREQMDAFRSQNSWDDRAVAWEQWLRAVL